MDNGDGQFVMVVHSVWFSTVRGQEFIQLYCVSRSELLNFVEKRFILRHILYIDMLFVLRE